MGAQADNDPVEGEEQGDAQPEQERSGSLEHQAVGDGGTKLLGDGLVQVRDCTRVGSHSPGPALHVPSLPHSPLESYASGSMPVLEGAAVNQEHRMPLRLSEDSYLQPLLHGNVGGASDQQLTSCKVRCSQFAGCSFEPCLLAFSQCPLLSGLLETSPDEIASAALLR